MKKDNSKPTSFEKLRRQAENLLLERGADRANVPLKDMNELIHELEVHQIELEMQNDELRQVQFELEASRDRYLDLYDLAPVGYFSLSDKGVILGANLMGATMLGIERGKLKGKHFSQFIAKDDQDVFYHHRQKLIEMKTKQTCELKLTQKDETEFYVQLDSNAVKDEAGNLAIFLSASKPRWHSLQPSKR